MTDNDGDMTLIPQGAGTFMVPCEPSEFGDFLSGLLKSSNSMRFVSSVPFLVRFEDIEDFDRLVHHRISEQQKYSLISNEFAAFYDDGTSRHCGSMREFSEHVVFGDVVCTKITGNWVYLIDLPNEDVPQRQEIFLSFSLNRMAKSKRKVVAMESLDRGASPELRFANEAAELYIRHSHISFGNDMMNLLQQRLKRLERTSKRVQFFERLWVSVIWYVAFLLLGLSGSALFTQILSYTLSIDVIDLLEALKTGALVTILIYSSIITIVTCVVCIAAGGALHSLVTEKPNSYILLNQDHHNKFREQERKSRNSVRRATLTMLGSLFLGVSGSLIATGILEAGFTRFFIK